MRGDAREAGHPSDSEGHGYRGEAKCAGEPSGACPRGEGCLVVAAKKVDP